MTEAEWLACEEPADLLQYAENRTENIPVTQRRTLLFAAACCSRLRHLIRSRIGGDTVEWLEAIADGQKTKRDSGGLHRSLFRAHRACSDERVRAALNALDRARHGATIASLHAVVWQVARSVARVIASDENQRMSEDAFHTRYARDIFGNPFRPVVFSPDWRTDTAVSLARGMYDARDFSAMPILADALQDAGCDESAILEHCRAEGATHVRGCWVVDLALGKM